MNLLTLPLCCGFPCHSVISPGSYTPVFMVAVMWRRKGTVLGHFHIAIMANTCRFSVGKDSTLNFTVESLFRNAQSWEESSVGRASPTFAWRLDTLAPQHAQRARHSALHWEGNDRQVPEVPWPPSLVSLVSSRPVRRKQRTEMNAIGSGV